MFGRCPAVPPPKGWYSGTPATGGSVFPFQLLFQAMNRALGLAHFLGAVTDAVSFPQKALQLSKHIMESAEAEENQWKEYQSP